MTNRLLAKFGLFYSLGVLLGLLVLDFCVVRWLKQVHQESAFSQLEALSRVALANLPGSWQEKELREWTRWLSQSGARVTVVDKDGKVLADSGVEVSAVPSRFPGPEIGEAMLKGSGRALGHSPMLKLDYAYLAKRYNIAEGSPIVLRFALPQQRFKQSVQVFRKTFWVAGLGFFSLSLVSWLRCSQSIARRVHRLKEFCDRVAEGDFRPLPLDRHRDELADLAKALNQTAVKLNHTISNLIEQRNWSSAILSSMEEGVAVIGTDQRMVYCNQLFCQAAGTPGISCQGRPIMEIIRHSDLLSYIQTALIAGKPIRGEVVVGSVQTRSYAVTAAPIRTNGAISGAVMVLHDITEIRRLERARRDFVANISHEFKTPLTAIQGFAETLLGGALEDDQNRRRFLEIIREHALRLGRLTDDLLKLSQIEAGKSVREAKPVDVKEIIGQCLEIAQIKAEQKRVTLDADYRDDLPKLHGDVYCLREVLHNLLDNALR